MFDESLKIGFCGETKIGKSHFGARFVKEFDGVFLDFAGVQQFKKGIKEAPQYDVTKLRKGEAYTACKAVGINLDSQYMFLKNWEDLEAAIEYARMYRDTISTKASKRVWLVFDDTNLWRWHEAIHASKVNSHKSIVKDDWGQATTNMTLRIRELEPEFNLLFISQMKDQYASGENTGQRVGAWYPPSSDYTLDIVGELWVDRNKKPFVQHMKIYASRKCWLCLDNFTDDIVNPDPRTMLATLQVDEALW